MRLASCYGGISTTSKSFLYCSSFTNFFVVKLNTCEKYYGGNYNV